MEIALEFSIHGYIEQQGAYRVGQTLNQQTRELIESQLSDDQHACVKAEASRVAEALRAAGYFGPFGIDGYVGALEGAPVFVPRSEINARFTMNFPANLVPSSLGS